jgi:O-antigen/teichoic acid export membrane protein
MFYLGPELYGAWLVVLSIIAYLGLANLGVINYATNKMAAAYAVNDWTELNKTASTACLFYLALILPFSLTIAFISQFIGPIFFRGETHSAINFVITISSLFFLISLPLQIFNVVMRSINKVREEQMCVFGGTLIRFFSLFICLKAGLKLEAIAVVHGISLLLPGLMIYAYLKKYAINFNLASSFFSKKLIKSMVVPSFAFFLIQLSGGLVLGTDNLVISYFEDVKSVAAYSTAFRLCMIVIGAVSIFSYTLLPTITRHYELTNEDFLKRLFLWLMKFSITAGLNAFIFLLFFGHALIEKWVGHAGYPGNGVFFLLLTFMLIQSFLLAPEVFLLATNHHKRYAILAFTEALLNLALSIWWASALGVKGVILATLAARFITNVWYLPVAASHVIQFKVKDWMPLMPLILLSVIIFLIMAVAHETIMNMNYFFIVCVLGMFSILSGLGLWTTWKEIRFLTQHCEN